MKRIRVPVMLKWISKYFSGLPAAILAAVVMLLLFVPYSWGAHYSRSFIREEQFQNESSNRTSTPIRRESGFRLTKSRKMERQREEWQSMSPEEKKRLRRKMEQWRRIPSREKELYQKRFQQWQQIDPEERKRLEDKILRWNQLSPAEKEEIRKKFRK